VGLESGSHNRMNRIGEIVVGAAFAAVAFTALNGCEGDAGKSGRNLLGADLQPPLVELILPFAGRQLYDRATVEAFVSDDDSVARVEFLVDGVWDTTRLSDIFIPPWQTVWGCDDLSSGSHTLQARAWDGMGRVGYSPLVMLFKSDSAARPETDTIRFFTVSPSDSYPVGASDYYAWSLPDPQGRWTGFGARFTPDRPCTVLNAGVRIFWGKDWQFSQFSLTVEFWKAAGGKPDSLLFSRAVSMRAMSGEDQNVWKTANAASGGLAMDGEFFVTVRLPDEPRDTVAVLSDRGMWNNGHGVVYENGEWRPFSSSAVVQFNPLVYAVVRY